MLPSTLLVRVQPSVRQFFWFQVDWVVITSSNAIAKKNARDSPLPKKTRNLRAIRTDHPPLPGLAKSQANIF